MRRHSWIGGALAAGVLFAATAAWQHVDRGQAASPGAAQAQVSGPMDTFRLVWSQPIPALRAASLSANGKDIVTVDTPGNVRLWDWAKQPIRPLWTHRIPGIMDAQTSADGKTVLAYNLLDPTRPSLTWLGPKGKLLGRSTLDGAVWAAALSPQGLYAGVTTGSDAKAAQGSLYVYALSPRPAQIRKERLTGIGDSVAVGRQAGELAVGTWDDSAFYWCTPQGAASLPLPPPSSREVTMPLMDVQIAPAGDAILGLSSANIRGAHPTLYYWRERDKRLVWSYPLESRAEHPRTLISENGQRVAVTYTRSVSHGDQTLTERRLLLLDAGGHVLWQKGGLLFSPTLVSIAADGHRVTVWDGQNTLYHLDSAGRVTAPYRFRAAISRAWGSPDGHWLLVSTQDGLLNLLRLDAPAR